MLLDNGEYARSRWLVLAGAWFIYFTFGIATTSLAPFIHQISKDLEISSASFGLILGSWPIVYIFVAIPAGFLIDRFGPGKGMLLAGILIALSQAGRAFAFDPISLGISVALLGLGGPIVSVGAPKLIIMCFPPKERAQGMGIYITGPYVGSLIALVSSNFLMDGAMAGSWRSVMITWSILTFAVTVFWRVVYRKSRKDFQLGGRTSLARLKKNSIVKMLGSFEVVAVLLIGVSVFYQNHAFNNWLPAILAATGMEASEAGLWASVPSIVGIGAALTIPKISSRRRNIFIMISLTTAVAITAFLIQSEGTVLKALALIFLGISRGAMMTIALLMLFDVQSILEEDRGLASGLFFSLGQVGGALGPIIFGLLLGVSGDFRAPLFSIVCASIFIAVCALKISRVRKN